MSNLYPLVNPFSGKHVFDEQVALAKAEQQYKGAYHVPPKGMWDDSANSPHPGVLKHKVGDDSLQQLQETLADPHFDEFVSDSYNAPEGYTIRINPVTGKKEMMVAGTRHATQWLLNAYDSGLYGADKAATTAINDIINLPLAALEEIPLVGEMIPHPHLKHGVKLFERLDPWRQKKQKYYAQIAKENNVDLVYGHSRGGAMVADMKLPKGTQKVGLDAAMLIAHNTGMKNLNEGGGLNPLGLFDEAIGLTGKDNVTFDMSTFSPHKVWRT